MENFKVSNTPILRRNPQRKSGKAKTVIFICLVIVVGFYFWKTKSKEEAPKENTTLNIVEEKKVKPESQEKIISYVVSDGDIPAEVFKEYGKFNINDIESILASSADIYNLSKIKIGQKIDFVFGEKEKAAKIKYFLDTENVIIIETTNDGFRARKENIPYATENKVLSLEIDEFLYKDALDAGLSESSILEIADIFSFDIDFTTEIQPGDKLKVLYEKRSLDGSEAPDGKILAAKFINSGQEYSAYYFENNGIGSHYDGDGHELVRQFLRAPLSYRQITSGFTGARYHPITKKVSAHYQIDYAAATGTPVVSTARGTITSAGRESGWGNMIRLRHDNGYTTHYGHLSAFAKGIKSGASVSQGQTIGYVGSTGWSTGPHLDYGMKLNGTPVNPLSLKLPKGNPIGGDSMEKFQEAKKEFDEILK